MTTPHSTTDRDSALAFIAAQQEDKSTATAYVETLDENLESDLDDLDQPWMQTLRVIEGAGGAITGAALVEWDADVSTAWVYGPWTTPDTWATDAPVLLDAVVEQADVNRFQLYGDVMNTRMAELSEGLGWEAGPVNVVFQAERAAQGQPDAHVRAATSDDETALKRLHQMAFPDSYATVTQLLAPDSEYTTLVLTDGDTVIGYAAGQPDGDDAYLDFVAVDPSRRRRGVASRLVRALADALPGDMISLTCDTTQVAAIALYESLEWERESQTRAYDLRRT